jgi:tetratricopeptide (TPR) repeat protein
MELLTSFNAYICDKKLTEEEVIKLGCDICTALEICAKLNIIHRDIKPENIFINDFGYFKLGDFGIARKMENMTGSLSQKGTFNYMAPEVANSSEYDARVDTYSLGIVLYRLLNGKRLPFLDTEKQLLSPNERRKALDRRLRGEDLPEPCDASPAMADLILRACAYDPNMRFASATEMKQALMSVANGTYQIAVSNLDRTTSVRKVADSYDRTTSVCKPPVAPNQKVVSAVNTFGSVKKKKSKLPVILSVALALSLFIGTGAFLVKMNMDKKAEINTIIEEAQVLADAEDFSGAISKIEDGLDEYSDEDKLQEKLDEYQISLTNQQIAAMIVSADVLASNGDYEGAIELVEAGLANHPDNSSLQGKITEYNAALAAQVKAATLADAQALADSGDYVSAIALIEEAQETQGADTDFKSALNAYKNSYKAQVIADADRLAENGRYLDAVDTVGAAVTVIGEDAEITSRVTKYKNDHAEAVVLRADDLVSQGDYDGAIALLEMTKDAVGNKDILTNKITEIKDRKPVSLLKMHVVDQKYYETGIYEDTYGNEYTSAFIIGSYYDWHGNVSFNLKGEYSKLTFVLAAYTRGSDEVYKVKVCADGETLYTSSTSALTAPQKVSLDITGCELLTIERLDGVGMWAEYIIIGDPCVQK